MRNKKYLDSTFFIELTWTNFGNFQNWKNVILLYYVLFSFVHFPLNLSLYRNNIRQISGIPW